MNRRKFMVGLGSLAAGGAATMGTGAFDNVTATRDADISVVNDESALLSLSPKRSQYAELVNGQLFVRFNSDMNGTTADGVNANATTVVNDIFTIANKGDRGVTVTIDDSGLTNQSAVYWNNTTNSTADTSAEFETSNGVSIGTGDAKSVGVYIDTSNLSPGDKIAEDNDKIEIVAQN